MVFFGNNLGIAHQSPIGGSEIIPICESEDDLVGRSGTGFEPLWSDEICLQCHADLREIARFRRSLPWARNHALNRRRRQYQYEFIWWPFRKISEGDLLLDPKGMPHRLGNFIQIVAWPDQVSKKQFRNSSVPERSAAVRGRELIGRQTVLGSEETTLAERGKITRKEASDGSFATAIQRIR